MKVIYWSRRQKKSLLAYSKVPNVNFYLGIICSLYVVTRKMVNYTCVE